MTGLKNRQTRKSNAAVDATKGLSRVLIEIATIPVRVITFLTTPPGSAITIGLGVIYFAGISAEGYWQAMSPNNPAFMPKPFINDNANLVYLLSAIIAPSFWLASVVSLVVQGIQAFVLREVEIAKAKEEYEQVKHYRVPDEQEGELDVAKYRRDRFKSAGMRTIRTRGALIALTYFADIGIAFWNYPIVGQTTGAVFINLVWILASIFGTEAMINLFMNAFAPIKNKPDVEILN